MKKFLSVLLAVLLLALCALPLVVFAETTEPNYIYFSVPTEGAVAWRNFSAVYCHIWSKTGGDIYGWQEKAERCEDMGNGCWRYDLSGITFDPASEYSLIFSNELGLQTYNLNVTSSCLGDIAYCSGDTCVNPVDGEKTCAVARWMNNGEKVHPAIEVDSNGALLNVDGVDAAEAETLWGNSAGGSYELPEAAEASDDADDAGNGGEDASLLIAPAPDSAVDSTADNADGINLTAATTWIVIVCVVLFLAIAAVVVILARRNRKK